MASTSDDVPVTLTHHILAERQTLHPDSTGEFSILLHSIEIACKYISAKVRAAGLFDLYGAHGSTNVQGEEVKKLDVLANDAMIHNMRRSRTVSLMISEENETVISVDEHKDAKYIVCFDPLDGSSNIDVNGTIGTIYAIFRRDDVSKPASLDDVKTSNLVAAGYCMYGSATLMVLSCGHGVNAFTLDPTSGEFILTHPSIRIPESRAIYSVNEGNSKHWFPATIGYVDHIKNKAKAAYSARYIGSMVGDMHRTLLYGGIFMYPGDQRAPNGKLRLLYEVFPMSFIVEQAGGRATTGTQRILDIIPSELHQRVGCYLGSTAQVTELESFFQNHQE